MYWLLKEVEKEKVRNEIDNLVRSLSCITDNPHIDQLFPYVGRKDRRKASVVIQCLTPNNGTVVEPFGGSGTFVYSSYIEGRKSLSNEWEPYANRISNAPWRVPEVDSLKNALNELVDSIKKDIDFLYYTKCPCGENHILDSLFFDREPLNYRNITKHERLGPNLENITYRGKFKCPSCGRTEKQFDDSDNQHLDKVNRIPIPEDYNRIFNSPLIENSRINITGEFKIYGNLFPHRSKIALIYIWNGIISLNYNEHIKAFLQDVLLSILPQAKFKDYRSKSQDLHVPKIQLREVNLLNRFISQFETRLDGLKSYSFSTDSDTQPIKCLDFREFYSTIEDDGVELVLTDPPWTDGNAYFEKAQLYHPWIGYNLLSDANRMENEYVVTDAPSRSSIHNIERWWNDTSIFFEESYRILKSQSYLALFFRPIPAAKWLFNLNRLKLLARKAGFEPLLSIDVASSDPSMRIQQSASYVFSQDVIFIFIKLPNNIRRLFEGDHDIDHIAYQVAEEMQERKRGPISYREWRDEIGTRFVLLGIGNLNNPSSEEKLHGIFLRYCDEVNPGYFLPKAVTPFSGQLFDTPAIERLFTYVPFVVESLTKTSDEFTYDQFLLKLAEYVENGTRMLIDQVQEIDIKKIIEPYAEIIDGRKFKKRSLPSLPAGIKNVLELDPYEFEIFIGKLLEAQGYTSVVIIGRSGDRGVDLVATSPDGISTVIQCKRYFQHNVSSTPVQRLHSFSITRGAGRRILITTSNFTPQSVEEVRNTDTELINGEELEVLISRHLPGYFSEK